MEDTFIIFFDKRVLVALTGLTEIPHPDAHQILDWYAKNFAFDRKRLMGGYVHSYPTKESDYHEMWKERGLLAPLAAQPQEA